MSHSRVWFKRDLRLRERLAVMFPGFYPKLQTRAGITGNNTIRRCNPMNQSPEHDPDATLRKFRKRRTAPVTGLARYRATAGERGFSPKGTAKQAYIAPASSTRKSQPGSSPVMAEYRRSHAARYSGFTLQRFPVNKTEYHGLDKMITQGATSPLHDVLFDKKLGKMNHQQGYERPHYPLGDPSPRVEQGCHD